MLVRFYLEEDVSLSSSTDVASGIELIGDDYDDAEEEENTSAEKKSISNATLHNRKNSFLFLLRMPHPRTGPAKRERNKKSSNEPCSILWVLYLHSVFVDFYRKG